MPPPDRTRNGSRCGTPVHGCAWVCVTDESPSLLLGVCDGAGVVAGVALTMAAPSLRVVGAGATDCGFDTRVGEDRRTRGQTTLISTNTNAAATSRPTTRGLRRSFIPASPPLTRVGRRPLPDEPNSNCRSRPVRADRCAVSVTETA